MRGREGEGGGGGGGGGGGERERERERALNNYTKRSFYDYQHNMSLSQTNIHTTNRAQHDNASGYSHTCIKVTVPVDHMHTGHSTDLGT